MTPSATIHQLPTAANRRMGIERRHGQGQPSSSFLRDLAQDIRTAWVPEAELTMRVAVMSAGGMTRAQIVAQTGADELDVRMALKRLERIAEGWRAA